MHGSDSLDHPSANRTDMGPPEDFAQFARQTIRTLSLSKLPWSTTPTSLREQYVELKVADSAGTLFPVGDLLRQGVRLVLVGDPGAGKTTALREFAVRKSEDYLAGTADALPVFISLREAFHRDAGDLFSSVELPESQLVTQRLLLLLDGLDELHYDRRPHALREIAKASRQLSNAQILLASRPSGLSPPLPDEFRFYHLESLDSAQLLQIVAKLPGDKQGIDLFREALSSSPFLEGLSRSPLLISLVWQVFQNRFRLPTVRAELYQTACDLLLSTWDSARAITRDRPLTLAKMHDVLSVVALDAFTQSAVRMPAQRLRSVLSDYLRDAGETGSVDSVLGQLMGTGLLIEDSYQSVSFPHLSFMEFYAARQLAHSPRRLATLISLGTPSVKELAIFAAGMLTDVAPLVEAAVDRRELILAATCLREGLTENGTLETYVLDQLRRELGQELVRKLTDSAYAPSQATAGESIHALLLKALIDCRASTLSPNESALQNP